MGLLQNIKAEPVRWFSAASALVPLGTTGLIVFDAWHPTLDQLAYVNGLPAAIALAVGVSVVRNAVASKPNVKAVDPATARELWSDPPGP